MRFDETTARYGDFGSFYVGHIVTKDNLQDLLQQGKVLYETGRLVEAQAVLQRVSQQYQVLGDKLRQAMTLSNLALVYQQRGMLAEANQAINDSLQLLGTHSKQHLQVLAQTLEIQGSLQLEQGQAEVALKTWQRSLDTYTLFKVLVFVPLLVLYSPTGIHTNWFPFESCITIPSSTLVPLSSAISNPPGITTSLSMSDLMGRL